MTKTRNACKIQRLEKKYGITLDIEHTYKNQTNKRIRVLSQQNFRLLQIESLCKQTKFYETNEICFGKGRKHFD